MKLKQTGPWIEHSGPDADVVVSSRARLARNLTGLPFVNQASDPQRREILQLIRSLPFASERGEGLVWIDLQQSTSEDRRLLFERHLVSRQFIDSVSPRAVAIADDEQLSVMVNEEDHLRMQVLLPGLELEEAWRRAVEFDRRLEKHADLAVHPRWGYLTACPTNVGTAIRFSVMLHLPGLRLTNELERLRRASNDLDLAVRGFYGEGSDSSGDFYQVSNQLTLGVSETDLLATFVGEVVPRIVAYERMARDILVERSATLLEDRVHRALGTLRSARLLGIEESMKHLSRVRLGIALGLLPDVPLGTVQRLFLEVQPAHLRRIRPDSIDDTALEPVGEDRMLDDERTRRRRAALVRQELGG